MKKFFFLILIVILFDTKLNAEKKIFIITKVNDQIITNLDVEKEASYLKILNPKLNQVQNDQILL